MTFEDTPNQHKVVVPTNLQILNQVELVEVLVLNLLKKSLANQLQKANLT
jgi:hypothetical protein